MLLAALLIIVAAGIGQAAASPWGPPTTVHVAARDLAVGDVLTDGDVRRRGWPRDLVPPDAVTVDVTGTTVLAPLPAGAVVTDAHLGDAGLGGAVGSGRAGVAVPLEVVPTTTPGMRVDLVTVDLDGRGIRLAADATVLTVDGAHVWVEVERDASADVAAAARSGALAVVVVPP